MRQQRHCIGTAVSLLCLLFLCCAGQDQQLCCGTGQTLDKEKIQCFDAEQGKWIDPRSDCLLRRGEVLPGDDNKEGVAAPIVIRKCCPAGESVNRTDVGQCVSSGQDSESLFNSSIQKWMDPKISSYRIWNNASIVCDYDVNVYLPKKFADNRFVINGSGHLVVKAAIYEILRHSDYYCVDYAVDSQGNQSEIAMMCLAKKMYTIRFFLWSIANYLHFISAFFLLCTLLVYSVLPSLRDNIQGYSLMCFLICMIIVQGEYGIILSVPQEPHTWCFSKVWIGTYFRYSSSTWITVMGFNIWSQLYHPRRFTRPQLLKRFAFCSLYAWGIPLVLQLSVFTYIEILKNGRPAVKLCWFGDPVVKHLLSTPNVILVTANLIFFIPSVLKVYGSFRFLKTSVSTVTLGKLEKERITTIFRFFLLMQFYTIPRIIHEIVDTDNASPKLLAISVSLYLLIGPAMFYFFVCKREVSKLLKEMVGKKRSSPPHAWNQQSTNSKNITRTISTTTSTTSLAISASPSPTEEPVQFNIGCEMDNPAFSANE